MTDNLALMAIFAHPDDEAFGTGGILSKYSHEGVAVHLVTATLGEAGDLANPDVKITVPMSIKREQELRSACKAYGPIKLHLLGYMDGQTATVPLTEAVYKIVKLIRQYKPQVVVTFGPEGIYGHFDHLVIHRWASAAVSLAASHETWPMAGEAHQVTKFYYRVITQTQVDQMAETYGRDFVPMGGGIPFPFIGYPDEQVTTMVDIRNYLSHKIAGIRCHASQIDPTMPALQEDYDHTTDPGMWQESFILVKSTLANTAVSSEKLETDLFAGLR